MDTPLADDVDKSAKLRFLSSSHASNDAFCPSFVVHRAALD